MNEHPAPPILSFPDRARAYAVAVYGTLATAVFTLIYGYTNYRATTVSGRYTLYADWERDIPLVHWMVYPYISLNLLFIACIFVIRDAKIVRSLCLSLCAGAFVAGWIFFFFPGELGFARASGETQSAIFQQIYSLDHPHNLYPSLHVTYSTLAVWAMRTQVESRPFRVFLWAWLALISLSVVLTHQHHVFDVLTGAGLAVALIPFFFGREQDV